MVAGMGMPTGPSSTGAAWRRAAPAALTWAAGWLALLLLDGTLDLANLALLLVLVSAVAALWLPGWATVLCSTLVVMAFNWVFVPPRHSCAPGATSCATPPTPRRTPARCTTRWQPPPAYRSRCAC